MHVEPNKGHISVLGIFPLDDDYFVTRYPLSITSHVRPFDSLEINIWSHYALLFIIFILTSIAIESELNKKMKFYEMLTSILNLFNTIWFKVITATILCSTIFSFFIWTFNMFYGIDLWSSLVGQVFEPEVNKWDDINFMDTQFIIVVTRVETYAPTLLLANLFYIPEFVTYNITNIYPNQKNMPKFHLSKTGQISLLRKHMENAQLMKNPSDIVFIMKKSSYRFLGKSIKKLGIPYKLRLSREPLDGYSNKGGKSWHIGRYSVFIELAAIAILKSQVR